MRSFFKKFAVHAFISIMGAGFAATFVPSVYANPGDVNISLAHGSREHRTDHTSKRIGNEIFYQIVIDRFHNGNNANDCLYDGRYCSPDHTDWYKHWGGDLRGVIQQMPYLKSLGVTRIWLTPIFENTQVEVPRFRFGEDVLISAYHGYWIKDWFKLNPVFTDRGRDDFDIVQEMINAGLPQIKFLLDSVTNHSSPTDATDESINYLGSIDAIDQASGTPRTHRGALFRDGQYLTGVEEDFARSVSESGYQTLFHHTPFISDNSTQQQNEDHLLNGLADLDQHRPFVQSYLKDAHRFWLEKFPDLAGYRMDTIKHVPLWYWKQFDREINEIRPGVEAVGEYFDGGPMNTHSQRFYRETSMSLFDFDFRRALRDIYLRNQPFGRLVDVWRADGALGDAKGLVTFIDNHDISRLRGEGLTFEDMRQAVALLFIARGIPCVYYGLEQDLFASTDPGDPFNRPMMRSFAQDAPLFTIIQRLSALRQRNLALRYGSTHVVHLTDNIIAFERIHDDGSKVLLVASKNRREGEDQFSISGLTMPNGSYHDVLTGDEHRVQNGSLSVRLGYGEVIILSNR